MEFRRMSLLLPLLSAVMVTQDSAGFWETVGKIAICVAAVSVFGKREADLPDPLKESVLAELVQNLANECMEAKSQSIDEDLAMDTLLNKFHQLDENGDVKLTEQELTNFRKSLSLISANSWKNSSSRSHKLAGAIDARLC